MKRYFISITLVLLSLCLLGQQEQNYHRAKGYKGIWFELGQKYPYGDKYSGGLGTYTAKHMPMAIYSPESNKTFLVYGGTTGPNEKHLQCMIGFYDHATGMVPQPVIVYDKQGVDDPHDNPSLLIDENGYIWVFVSGRGTARPGYKYKSTQPHSIDTFLQITTEEMTYPQPWFLEGKGYFHFFTKYSGKRELYFERSQDGRHWTADKKLAGIKAHNNELSGHYQVSGRHGQKLGTFFNWHPDGNVDKRTNLYYLETTNFGDSWHNAAGDEIQIPIHDLNTSTLVKEYFSEHQNVYLKDINFDSSGNPVALFVVSNGHEPGPVNGLRQWKVAHWNGNQWTINNVCTSDHNYDMGSLYINNNIWQVIAPTGTGPQPWGTGGEVCLWESKNSGATWILKKNITTQSKYNHAYIRRPVNAHPDFYAFWADGNPNEFSISRLYFINAKGEVFVLPYSMDSKMETPDRF